MRSTFTFMKSKFCILNSALCILIFSISLAAQYEGWTIPANAKAEKNPMAGVADAARKGKSIFQSRCQRCHGAEGRGNGPEADPKVPPANLAQIKTDLNPDGVLFYKVWNGHQPHAGSKGSMPAFKVQMVREDVWRVIEYVKTLQRPAA